MSIVERLTEEEIGQLDSWRRNQRRYLRVAIIITILVGLYCAFHIYVALTIASRAPGPFVLLGVGNLDLASQYPGHQVVVSFAFMKTIYFATLPVIIWTYYYLSKKRFLVTMKLWKLVRETSGEEAGSASAG